jgi:AhpD family alkylhydroperoxidase
VSWIAPPAGRDLPWHVRLLLAFLARRGRLSGAARLWARAPAPFLRFLRLYRAVDREGSPLEPGLRALVMARVSQLEACAFCVDLNGSRALERGVPREKLEALARGASSPAFSERERLALAFAEAVSARAGVPEALRERLRAAFGEDGVVELAALVAFQGMSARFNAALDVAPEGFCSRS